MSCQCVHSAPHQRGFQLHIKNISFIRFRILLNFVTFAVRMCFVLLADDGNFHVLYNLLTICVVSTVDFTRLHFLPNQVLKVKLHQSICL